MKKITVFVIITGLFLISAVTSSNAVVKAERKMNVLEFQIGGAQPMGEKDRFGSGDYEIIFQGADDLPFDLDASDIYKPALYFSINYGNLIKGQFYYNLGFHYVDLKHEDVVETDGYIYFGLEEIKTRVYALDINFNYYLTNPAYSVVSPYVGLGIQGGLLNSKVDGFSSSTELAYSLGLNVGADLKVWEEANGRSFLSIASANQFQFAASDIKPRYFQIGGAIKYFFRY